MPFTYHDITNPSPLADICVYLFPYAQCLLGSWWRYLQAPTKDKLILVTDRLKFISKLTILQKDIQSKHKYENEDNKDKNGILIRKQTFKCTYLDDNFAGVYFDIDALKIYLLTTCIDVIAAELPHKKLSEFIDGKSNAVDSNHYTNDILKSWLDEYEELFGLSKAFREQLLMKMSKPLRTKWLTHFCVCKTIGVQRSPDQNGKIEEESLEHWKNKSEDEKIKSIAVELYDMRSKFTHEAIRHLTPTLDVSQALYDHKKHLVQIGNMNLPLLLCATVRDLAEIMMREDYDNPSNRSEEEKLFRENSQYSELLPFYGPPDIEKEWWFCDIDTLV